MNEKNEIRWLEEGGTHVARWWSESGARVPQRIVVADDTMSADAAYRLACEGTALLWRGDFQNARQLLQAIARRVDRKRGKAARPGDGAMRGRKERFAQPLTDIPETANGPLPGMPDAFHLHRQAQAQRARILGMLLIPFEADYRIALRRAPDVRDACVEACGLAGEPFVASLRELLGLIGAHEWRKKGVLVPALGDRIHPHYGVFSPVRGEYVDLVARAPLPEGASGLAFDVGTGTGVLAALLARRGLRRVVATDQDARALACARENVERLGLGDRVDVVRAHLFPEGRAPLVVCNPPWLPGRPTSALEYAIYDPDNAMLRGFVDGLAAHLTPGGEGWLILSDLAEHLGLRSREMLLSLIDAAGLVVLGRLDVRPRHGKATDANDPLHAARALEVTSLWRLGAKGAATVGRACAEGASAARPSASIRCGSPDC